MTTALITPDYRNAHVGLPESSLKAPSLKWKWKWSTEVEVEFESKTFMAEPVSDRRSAKGEVRDGLSLTFDQGEAR